jgi:hypothetical protein
MSVPRNDAVKASIAALSILVFEIVCVLPVTIAMISFDYQPAGGCPTMPTPIAMSPAGLVMECVQPTAARSAHGPSTLNDSLLACIHCKPRCGIAQV